MDSNIIGEQVANNDLVLQQISLYIKHPADRAKARLASKRFNGAVTDYQNENTTLTFRKMNTESSTGVEVTFRDHRWILNDKFIKLDELIQQLPVDAYQCIKKVVVKGIRFEAKEDVTTNYLICLNQEFGHFLNRFTFLKHLEFECVYLNNTFFKKLPEYSFIGKIKNLHLLNMFYGDNELKGLVSLENLENLYLTEKMLRTEESLMKSLENTCVNVAIFLDERSGPNEMPVASKIVFAEVDGEMTESRRISQMDGTWYLNQIVKFHWVPYYKNFRKVLFLDNGKIPKIKQCEDLIELSLCKTDEEGDDVAIGNMISEIRCLPKLKKLIISGHFTTSQLRMLSLIMEDCQNLTTLSLIMGLPTINENDWIGVIRQIPERIKHLVLANIASDQAIVALNDQKSNSLLSLEWNVEKVEPSDEAMRMVTEDREMFVQLRELMIDTLKGMQFIRRYEMLHGLEFEAFGH